MSTKKGPSDQLQKEASVVAIIHFIDGNKVLRYSYDVQFRGRWQHGNLPYWLQYWKHRIEHESPDGWKGRVLEGAVFQNHGGHFDYTRDKLAQYIRGKGWIDIARS